MDYDAQGRVVTTSRDSDGLVVSRTFDEVGNQLSERYSAGSVPQETFMGWDAAGRMTWRTSDGGRLARYGYDADGRLVRETVARRNGSEESTEYERDASGRLEWREMPGRRRETFTCNPDDTLAVWTTALVNGADSAQLQLRHLYDPAGRVIRRYVENPEDFAGPPTGLATLVTDLGDAWDYDRLGRMASAGRVTARGADGDVEQDRLEEGSLVQYGFRTGDPRDLPETETIGYLDGWWNNVPGAIIRNHGAYGDLTRWTGPANIGSFATTPDALLRRSTVTWQPAAEGAVSGSYSWGGTARLMTADALGQSLVNGYGAPGTRLATRGAGLNGVALGNLAFTWDGPSNLKERRVPTSALGGIDVFGGHDWVWTHRDGARLGVGDSSKGMFEYDYGAGDEVAFARYEGAVRQFGQAGALGRPTTLTGPEGLEALGYDSLGRRTLDGRHRYTWSWRGELTEVEVVDPESELLGHRVTYEYDATGRLAGQTHFDAAGSEVDSRRFVWNDGELVAQVGLNHDHKVLWTVEHLPGPVGYDDSPVVRVTTGYSEYVPDPPPTARDYHLIRDEMGSVVAVLRGEATGAGEPPPLVARILYSPYGDAHLEPGPELLSVDHDLSLRTLDGIDQLEVATTYVDGEEVPAAVPGAMVFTFSLAMTVDSVSEAATLERWVVDEDGERWVDEAPEAYLVALDPANPRFVAVMPIEPWVESTRYRVTVRNVLRDGFGRTVIFPDRKDIYETELTVPAAPCEEVRFEGYPKRYPLTFDTVAAAAEWFECQPVPLDPDDPPDPEADPEQCFPGGLNLLFQGLWHDPVTGLAYARNRWYDARTAHWLTPDPMGAFDSPNQYAFVAWGPERYSDPTGEVGIGFAFDVGFACYDTHEWLKGNIGGWEYTGRMALTGASVVADIFTAGTASEFIGPARLGIRGARIGNRIVEATRLVNRAENAYNAGQASVSAWDAYTTGNTSRFGLSVTQVALGVFGLHRNTRIRPDLSSANMGFGAVNVRYEPIPAEHHWRYDRYLESPTTGDLGPARWWTRAQQAWANARGGNQFERQVREALGAPVGRGSKPSKIDGFVPDLPIGGRFSVTDVKDWLDLVATPQTRAFFRHARRTGQAFNLIVSPRTRSISEPLLRMVRRSGGRVQQFDPSTRAFADIDIGIAGRWER